METQETSIYIPQSFQVVQQMLDSFVQINYETALSQIIVANISQTDINNNNGKVLDIIRNNPPLASVPRYLHDGREDYLWYSDFYDEITKEVYQQYMEFVKSDTEITTSNYVEELSKITLPYFQQLVDLVNLERLSQYYQKHLPIEKDIPKTASVAKTAKAKVVKRSYEPQLAPKQYKEILICIEQIRLFRRPIKVTELKRLFNGKLAEPLQVTNQKTLVYLFDYLKDSNFIKDTWMSVADGNKDFISFRTEGNKGRYGDQDHYINMQQLLNSRNRNKRELIFGLEDIDDLIEELKKYEVE